MTEIPVPLERAFAHGDCAHSRPLLDALGLGFCYIEADVYVVDGEVLVGHDREDLSPDRTLRSLYLEPLAERVRRNGGQVYSRLSQFSLLLDFKDDGPAIYEAVKPLLHEYGFMLTSFEGGVISKRAVNILVSGDRPVGVMAREVHRLAFVDGRLNDLDDPSNIDPNLTPLVSDNYEKLFSWAGDGEMPREQFARLRDLCDRAHRGGAKIRFWATPDRTEVWTTLLSAGVDVLNTDDLVGLSRFLGESLLD